METKCVIWNAKQPNIKFCNFHRVRHIASTINEIFNKPTFLTFFHCKLQNVCDLQNVCHPIYLIVINYMQIQYNYIYLLLTHDRPCRAEM